MLYDINKNSWSKSLLKIFNIPASILPVVKDSVDEFGYTKIFGSKIKIGGIAGDQQAATIGQACFEPGSIKSTYGTGCFMIMNIGKNIKISKNNLLTTIAYRIKGKTTYALEGSIFIAGAAIQWLRDSLKVISSAEETEDLYKSNDKSQQIYFVPAFVGLGAPYWDAKARGAIFGITRDTSKEDITKATLESVAFQSKDLVEAMKKDNATFKKLMIDGGMVNNNWFCQQLANTLQVEVSRPVIIETTSLGAAFLAGLKAELFEDLSSLEETKVIDKVFLPNAEEGRYQEWKEAVKKILS